MKASQTEIIITFEGVELLRVTKPPGDYAIGRGAECDLVADGGGISRKHARLFVKYYETYIENLGSSNGTFVAGKRLANDGSSTRIYPGQKVQLAHATLECVRHADDAPEENPHTEVLRKHLPDEMVRGDKKFTVGTALGRGGMGEVLEAFENPLRRRVAMKRMHDSFDLDALVRFIEEAQITAQLDHPGVVPVFELGVDAQEQPYYTMQRVRGITLDKVLSLLAEGTPDTVKKFPLSVLLVVFQKMADALAYAHSKGVLHRDLKPENIMLGEYGEVFVMDWGLARAEGKNLGGANRSLIQAVREERTMVGLIVGTPQYMAPEQATGATDQFDARTDIYALGAILCHMLTLEPPVLGDDVGTILQSVAAGNVAPQLTHRSADPTRALPHLPDGKIPAVLASIARRAMSLRKEDRYAEVRDMQAAVAGFQIGERTAKVIPYWVWVVFALLVLVIALLLARH